MVLETYYRTPAFIEQVRNGPAGETIERFAGALAENGYSQSRAYALLGAARHIALWAQSRGQALDELTPEDLSNYALHAAHCRCLGGPSGRRAFKAKKHARVFLGYLERGCLGVRSTSRREPPPPLVQEFLFWLRQNRGLREASLAKYESVLAKIIDGLGDDLEKYTTAAVRRFIMEYGGEQSASSTKTTVNVLRAYVRFLTAEGLCVDTLGAAIPRFRCPPSEPLADVLSAKEAQRVLDATRPIDLLGARDRAILLLLFRLGLRASDVAGLRFSDVLWERGMLQVAGKSRQARCIPLPQEVGDALLDYMNVRPKVVTEEIFLRVTVPVRPFASRAAVTAVWRRALRRAGVRNPAPGKELLRHTTATHLARSGLRPESVATILRHRSISMTAHYTHANPRSLKGVVQPWPLKLAR